jgi:hypothetical protein
MRPSIVGLHNPHSADPLDALNVVPLGATGHRLWKMINDVNPAASKHYLSAFDRFNLAGADWEAFDRDVLATRAAGIMADTDRGTTIVLLGSDVSRAFSRILSEPIRKVFLHPQAIDGRVWRLIPHPSGRTLFYNDEPTRLMVGMLLSNLIRGNKR